jgi:threonine/homoserine efflux transporter RhtA
MDTLLTVRVAMLAAMPFAVYRLRRRALARGVPSWRQPTSAERRSLRQDARDAFVTLLAFFAVSYGLVGALVLHQAPPGLMWAGLVPMAAVGATWVSAQLRVVCPICCYPLGYQKPVGVPARCERCGASL